MTLKIIIDTDPGQDDALAILLALGSPEIELLGITCVAGNVPLEKTLRNARVVCELAGRADVKVYAGCDRPMQRPLVTAEHVHGKSGLDGYDLPDPVMKVQAQHAVDFLIETLAREPAGSVTLVPIGPLTNIATAFQRAPEVMARVKQIVLMGGAYFEVGNITPAAEFNIYVDPEAAQIVFTSGVKLVVLPLDVTHKVLTRKKWLEPIGAQGSRVSDAVMGWLYFFERFDVAKYGGDGGPLHDPCTIAWLIRPDLFAGRFINVEIELEGKYTTGMTVADWWGVSGRSPNALFLKDVDEAGFFALLTERIGRLPAA